MYLAVHINVDILILQLYQPELIFVCLRYYQFAYNLNMNTLFSFSTLAVTNKIICFLSRFWFLSLCRS